MTTEQRGVQNAGAGAGRRPPRPPSDRLRWRALTRLEEHLDTPMAILGVLWLALFVIEIVKGSNGVLTFLTTAIWMVFIGEFVLRLVIAPHRWVFIRKSWLTIIALLVPALRVLRVRPFHGYCSLPQRRSYARAWGVRPKYYAVSLDQH